MPILRPSEVVFSYSVSVPLPFRSFCGVAFERMNAVHGDAKG